MYVHVLDTYLLHSDLIYIQKKFRHISTTLAQIPVLCYGLRILGYEKFKKMLKDVPNYYYY
jgi:hypothetical protein